MQKNVLEYWVDIGQVYIPPIERYGFTENILSRDIWKKESSGLEEKEKAPVEETEEELTTLLQEQEDQTMLLTGSEHKEHAYFVRTNTNERIDFKEVPFIIGKSPKADYQIQGNQAISRFHIRISKTQDGYQMEDLDSSNHTYVQEQQVTEPVVLQENQAIKLADEEFIFHIEREQA